jgi:hypothetical protein
MAKFKKKKKKTRNSPSRTTQRSVPWPIGRNPAVLDVERPGSSRSGGGNRSRPAGRDPAFLAEARTARTAVQIPLSGTLSISPNRPYHEMQSPAGQILSSQASVPGRREKKKNERDGSGRERTFFFFIQRERRTFCFE